MSDNPSEIADTVARKNVFVFDWDGTLFDSMAIKYRTFAEAVSKSMTSFGYALPPDEIRQIYCRNSGLPRAVIMGKVAAHFGIDVSATQLQTISDCLSELNRAALIHARLHSDGVSLLDAALVRGISVFISSSVPQKELAYFVDLKLSTPARSSLAGILGSGSGFEKGPRHIEHIRKSCSCDPKDVLVIGDDVADDELSRAAGVDCIVVDRDRRLTEKVRISVSSLGEIEKCLK